MDCPSEEAMIGMALQDMSHIHSIQADFANRLLIVIHDENIDAIMKAIASLNFGAELKSTEEFSGTISERTNQRSALIFVLLINAACFVIEAVTGYFAGSIGLFADSLDMLADAIVYGLSLLVISGSLLMKSRIATLSGIFQMGLGMFGLIECLKRTLFGSEIPDYTFMIGVSLIAMIGNMLSMKILQHQNSNEPHMRASMIFTSNDIIANAGVILAGILTLLLSSMIPDLVIGCIIFLLVFRGAVQIIRLR